MNREGAGLGSGSSRGMEDPPIGRVGLQSGLLVAFISSRVGAVLSQHDPTGTC